jgi:hypothetical protein
MEEKRFYYPTGQGAEKEIKERLSLWRSLKAPDGVHNED